VKNSAKVTLLSFNATVVFQHDIMVSENDILEAGSAIDVFACYLRAQIINLNCKWSESEPTRRQFEFRRSPPCSTVC